MNRCRLQPEMRAGGGHGGVSVPCRHHSGVSGKWGVEWPGKSGDTVQRDRRGGAAECISRQYACGVSSECPWFFFGVPAEIRDGDLYGASEGRRKLPVGCLQGRKARLHSRKKIVNLLLIRKPTEKWPTRSPAGHSPCLHRYYFSADCSPPVRNNPRSRSTRCANVTT